MENKTFLSRIGWDTSQLLRKSLTSLKALTLLLVLCLSIGNAWGGWIDVVSFDASQKTAGSSAYSGNLTYGDWTIVNGANSNKQWTYFKMGGKKATLSSANPCYIYYSANTGVSSQVDSITVHIVSGSLSKSGMSVNSWGVYVYSDKAMTTQVDYVAGGTITNEAANFGFKPSAGKTWAKAYYYKVSWDLANTTTTNGIVCVDKITLHNYKELTCTKEPTVAFNAAGPIAKTINDDPFTNAASVTFESSATGQTITYASDKETVASVDENSGLVTINKVGTAVITATAAAEGDYCEASKSYTLNISKVDDPSQKVIDLSIDETTTASEDKLEWVGTYVTVTDAKYNSTTAANNYYPGSGSYSSTRMYKNAKLSITPKYGYVISSVEFTATSENYASVLANSTWTNGTATLSETNVTVTPTDGTSEIYAIVGGTCGFTKIVVNYAAIVSSKVTYSDPSNGILVIKNGDATIKSGETDVMVTTKLSVVATPTDATEYRVKSIAVTKTDGGDDVTADVYDASAKQITMPAYGITVAATMEEVPSYAISKVLNLENSGTISTKVAGTEVSTAKIGKTVAISAEKASDYYRLDSMKVYKSDDETTKVTVTDGTFEMPEYAVTVKAYFTKLFKVSLETAGAGTGTATINGGTADVYVDGDTQIALAANAVAPNEFTSWSATEDIAIDAESSAETYAYASGDGTITATFGISALTPLGTPTLSDPTNISYNGVTLNWQELANAEAYNVEILLNDDVVASDVIMEGTSWTPEATLTVNTTYTYTVQGVGDGITYAEENNPKATSTVTTADYPAAELKLSENNETRTYGSGLKLYSQIELPNCEVECDKVFVGWSESNTEFTNLIAAGTSYTMNATAVTLYAVFATETPGETSDVYTMNITKNTSNSAYATYFDVTFNSIGWKMPGNQASGDWVKMGGKFSTDTRYIYSKNAILSGVDKVVANHGTKDDAITVNSVTLDVYSTAALAEAGAAGDISSVAGTYVDNGNTTFERPSTANWTGRFYRITYNMSSSASGSNKGIILYSVKMQSVAAPTYSDYAVTCSAKTAAPEFSLAEDTYTTAQTLTITAETGAKIYYNINSDDDPTSESTEYTEAISLNTWGTKTIKAIAIADGKSASDVVSATYVMNLPFASLEALVAADIPSGSTVTVSFSNVPIKSIATNYKSERVGVYFDIQKGEKDIEIYCAGVPEAWVAGGKLSKSNLTCTWKRYPATGDLTCWELTPSNWDGFEYTDPAHITSIVISGEPSKKSYSDGQTLESDGLVVTGYYDDHTELAPHKETITEGLTWTLPTLTEGQTTAEVTVKYTEPILSTELTSEAYQVTGLSVSAAKTLSSIYVADDSQHQTKFFVGRPFSSAGLKVMAKYNIGDDEQITPSSISTPTMTDEGEQTITITYTENEVEKETSYKITLAYMDLSDLVAATDIEDGDYVYVKFTDQQIKSFYTSKGSNKGIYFDIQKENNDIEIYANGTACPSTWEQYGTVSATLNNVQWTKYGDTWELKPSNWDAFTYNAPNIPVTAMSVNPATVEVAELGSTTLSINYTPENATNKGVTWAVTEGDEYASVNETTGEVSGLKPGNAIVTATLTADPTIQATCSVTITTTPKCTLSYVVKGEEVHTQAIARESQSTIDYVPELVVLGYDFYGWSESTLVDEAASATIITEYTPGAEEASKTLYAIYKRVDDSSATFHKYAKVTSAPESWAGTYLIGYKATTFANGKTGGTDGIGAVNSSVNPGEALSNDVVTKAWGDEYKVTIEACTGGYLLKTQDGKYNYQTSNANGIATSTYATTADDYPITITLNQSGTVNMAVPAKPAFCYNTNGYFRFYKDGGNNNIYLYKYDEGAAFYTSEPTPKVKVTFNLDGGAGGCGNITIEQGGSATICENAPTKNLYKFNTWTDGENNYAPGATIENVTKNIELTALWIAKVQYTISFDKAGAAGTTPASITDYEGNQVTLPVQGDLSNPGFIFNGWNDGEVTRGGGALYTMPEKNVNMTAVWTAKTNDKWWRVESASQLEAGKQYAVVANTLESPVAMGDLAVVGGETKDYMSYVTAAFNADKSMMTAIDPAAVILTLGGDAENGWTLAKGAQYLGSEATKAMSWTNEIGEKTGYKWTITIADAEDNYNASMSPEGDYLRYNSSSPRFTTYSSSTTTMTNVQLYVKVPAQEVSGNVDASTISEHADVTVVDGGNLTLTSGTKNLGDVYVMAGGKVTIEESVTLTVQNFVIKSIMAGGQSGQVIGVTESNLVIEGNAYYDVTLDGNADPDKWHAVGVPFDVDAINGIYDMDDNKLVNETNYAVMVYQGDVRAQGKYGWIKIQKTNDKIMHPGVFYLFGVDGTKGTTYRFKMNGSFSVASKSINVYEYPQTSGVATDAGWNGIGNNQLEYSSIDKKVQVLNISSYTFEAKTASSTNFTVGTPFFYQAEGTGYVTLVTGTDNPAYAPTRMGAAEAKDIDVTLANDKYTDHLYVSATDEATNEYQIGRDLKKMTMTSAPVVPQIFAQAYNTKLCMVDAPMVNNEATYALSLYAPQAGEYTLSAAQVEGYEVFLTNKGEIIWNLSMDAYDVELNQGNTEVYGLVLRKAPNTPTAVEGVRGNAEGYQKFIYDERLIIIRNGQTYNAAGALVK